MSGFVTFFAPFFLLFIISSPCRSGATRVRARRHLRLGRLIGIKGQGLILLIPFRRMARQPAHRDAWTCAAGRHHARQRLGEDQRRSTPRRGRVKGIVESNFLYATSQIAQTTLRAIAVRPS
jgi:hypothetical protein